MVDLEAVRVEQLVAPIADELRIRGAAVATVEDHERDRWRRAARQAGRQLGWRVRTGFSGDRAWAVSEDWEPAPEADRYAADWWDQLMNVPTPRWRVLLGGRSDP